MGLLIFVWGIYIELQNCMYQTAHGPCLSQSLYKVYIIGVYRKCISYIITTSWEWKARTFIQCNLSKLNLIGTNLYKRKDRCSVYTDSFNKTSYIGTSYKVWFVQGFSLFRVLFRQVLQ